MSQRTFSLWTSRMLNITLPAFSLWHTSTSASGLAGSVSDYHELENLVLREKAVVWADQEVHQPKEESLEREAGGGGELAPVLSFSQLRYHTSSPCSESSVRHLLPLIAVGYLTRARSGLGRMCSNCRCLTMSELLLFCFARHLTTL